MSVLSSNCILFGKGVKPSSAITCSKILVDISEILERIVSFDKGTASIFFLYSKPQTSSTISNTHGFISDSAILCGFLFLAMRYTAL